MHNTMIAQGLIFAALMFNVVNMFQCYQLSGTSNEKLQDMGLTSRQDLAMKIGRRRNVGIAVLLLAIVAYQFIHPVGLVGFR